MERNTDQNSQQPQIQASQEEDEENKEQHFQEPTNNNQRNNDNEEVIDQNIDNKVKMIAEEFLRDWEEEVEMDPNSIYQLQRRQINLRGNYQFMKCQGHGFICSTAIYKNKYLFLGTSQNQLFCYDISNNQLIFDDYKHQDWVLSLQIASLKGTDIIISGGGLYDRSLCFYDLTNIDKGSVSFINQVLVHKKSITKMYYIEDKNILITSGSDFYFKIWKLELIDTDKKLNSHHDMISEGEEEQEQNQQNDKYLLGIVDQEYSEEEEDDRSDQYSFDEKSQFDIKVKLQHSICDQSQVYSVCESDDNFLVYGTGQGYIKVLKFNPITNKTRQIRSLKLQRSVWCLQRFTNFKFIVGYSFQTQGRVDIINIVTGQHIMNFFKYNECIHSFKIITRLSDTNIIIKNKNDFIKQCKNQIALVGASKLGMVKIVNIGDRINTPIEHAYSFDQNIEWIPWNPLSIYKQEQDPENLQFERYKIYCSTGNSDSYRSPSATLMPIISFDWSV